MKKYYDYYSGPSLQYKPRDKVLLDSKNIKTTRLTKKFNNKQLGPFEVDSKVGASVYKLKLSQEWFIHLVFNKILLKPYVPPAFNVQKVLPPPPSKLVNDKLEYEVESILDSCLYRRQLQYLVKQFEYQEVTQQPESNLTHAYQAISDFYKAYPVRGEVL